MLRPASHIYGKKLILLSWEAFVVFVIAEKHTTTTTGQHIHTLVIIQ